MKRITLLIALLAMLLLQSCVALWRGAIYNRPAVGDSKLFPYFCYCSPYRDIDYAVDTIVFSPVVDHGTAQTDFLAVWKDDVLKVYWGDPNALQSIHDVFSVTKSVVSLLMGIAIGEGAVGSIDDKVFSYIKGLDMSLKNTTLKELLQMRSGMDNSPLLETFMYYGGNLRWSVKQANIDQRRVGKFAYSDCSTQILSMVIEQATGKPIEEYFYEKIWLPMGMGGNSIWNLDSKWHRNARAFCGLSLSPDNLVSIGKLILNDGKYKGRTIVPREWIDRITHIEVREPTYIDGQYYNYHWRGIDDNIIYAKGLFGQYLYIDKTRGTIILRLGKSEGGVQWLDVLGKLAAESEYHPHNQIRMVAE